MQKATDTPPPVVVRDLGVNLSDLLDNLRLRGDHLWVATLYYQLVDPDVELNDARLDAIVAAREASCFWCKVNYRDWDKKLACFPIVMQAPR